jgi:membrane protease YdiL (CAAX protease family)
MGRTRKVREFGVLTRTAQSSPAGGQASSAVRHEASMEPQTADSDGFRMAVLVEGGVSLFALLLVWVFAVPVRAMLPDNFRSLGLQIAVGIIATLPMLATFYWILHAKHPALVQLREQVNWLVRELFPAASLPQFALVALLAGVGEELLFRGVIQTVLSEWTPPLVALIVTSLLFGLAHALSRIYFLLATLIGLYLGALMIGFDGLLAPMVAHAVYDFVALAHLSWKQHHAATDKR